MPSRSPGNKCSHLELCKRWDSVECDMSRSAAAFLAVSAKSAACQRRRHTVKFICFVAVSAVSDNPNEHCRHFTGRPQHDIFQLSLFVNCRMSVSKFHSRLILESQAVMASTVGVGSLCPSSVMQVSSLICSILTKASETKCRHYFFF